MALEEILYTAKGSIAILTLNKVFPSLYNANMDKPPKIADKDLTANSLVPNNPIQKCSSR